MEKPNNNFSLTLLIFVILCISVFFLFKNLGEIPFWQDEGETAVIASNILDTGIPVAWDGKNLVSSLNGYDFNDDLVWTWHPWGQFYTAALSFLILDKTTFAGRFPFALAGLFTIILTYIITAKITGNRKTAILAAFLLAINMQFILFSRQCRYYALLPLFSLIAAYSLSFIDKRKGFYLFILSSTMLFHSNYAPFPFVMAGAFLFVCLSRERNKIENFFISLIPIGLLTVPWFVYSEAYMRISEISPENRIKNYILQLQDMLYLVNEYMFPLILLLPLIYLFFRKCEGERKLALLCLCFSMPVIFLLPYVSYTQFIIGIRYATGCFPFMSILGAISIMIVIKKKRIWGILLLAFFIFTGLFSWFPSYIFRTMKSESPKYKVLPFSEELTNAFASKIVYREFLYELNNEYRSPVGGISDFLNENASPDDTVLTNYERDPLVFYTHRKMAYILSNEKFFRESIPAPRYNAVLEDKLPDYIFSAEKTDWLIERSNYPKRLYDFESIKDELEKKGLIEKIYYISFPDIPWSNRADLRYHKFRTAENYPPVKIYKIKKQKISD